MTNSTLKLGPISFLSHQVQSIDLYENKNAERIQPTRSDSGIIIPRGESDQAGAIRLIFSGTDEINKGLIPLICLFKSAPITSAYNELISTSWKYSDQDISWIPITLNTLSLTTQPSLPNTVYCDLVIKRIDASPISGAPVLKYKGRNKGKPEIDPNKSPWLKKWVEELANNNQLNSIPRSTTFDFYGQNALAQDLLSEKGKEEFPSLAFNINAAFAIGEACTIENYFSYNTLLGKSVPFAQHMGTSAKQFSIDVFYDTSSREGIEEFEKFNKFKEKSDKIIRETARPDRLIGWRVSSYLTKILDIKPIYRTVGNVSVSPPPHPSNIFVPLQVITKNGETPNTKQIKLSMAESNLNYISKSEFLLQEGGSSSQELFKFFQRIIDNEYRIRINFNSSNQLDISKKLALNSDNELVAQYEDFYTFWPISSNANFQNIITRNSLFGLLNKDTLRALILNSKVDQDGILREKLENIHLASNELKNRDINPANPDAVNRARDLTFFRRATLNYDVLSQALYGLDLTNPDVFELVQYLGDEIFDTIFVDPNQVTDDSSDPEFYTDFRIKFSTKLARGFLGDRNGFIDISTETGEILEDLVSSNIGFTENFVEALYYVITRRSGPPSNAFRAYDKEGLETAFYKLIVRYQSSPEFIKDLENRRSDYTPDPSTLTAFSDLLLPTYIELFGDNDWRQFAPTYSDLGLTNYSSLNNDPEDDSPHFEVAVSKYDPVHPGIWYHFEQFKLGPNGAYEISKKATQILTSSFDTLSLSIPFDTEDIDRVEEILEKEERSPEEKKQLSRIIETALSRYKADNEAEFKRDMQSLALAHSERFANKYLNGKGSGVKLYIHHNNNFGLRRRITSPSLGGEIYRVATEAQYITPYSETNPTEENYRAANSYDEYNFIRNSTDATEQSVTSSLQQMPEDFRNPATFFPACKVYLLDFRGDDIFADDLFFTLNPIISLDITLDKDDAGLAVIKVADPLHNLQEGTFQTSNVAKYGSKEYILGPMQGGDTGGYLKKYKIIQGRPVQIRMGYDSNPKNLPVVFTGKITEIVPGDILTIVCQDWKAELISRQVSFYNDDPENYGARDLAIQAITYADPQGFGTVFSQRQYDYILRNLRNIDAESALQNSLRNRRGITLEGVGNRSLGDDITNFIRTSVGLSSLAKRNLGVDTRLKNIWYPDMGENNNLFGWRSIFGWHPQWSSDSWIVPIKPCWEVLKEASRYAWNCIVQVVPYDGQGTLFMGNPDQPYYYTRGNFRDNASWSRYSRETNKKNTASISNIYSEFLNSKFYKNTELSDAFDQIINAPKYKRFESPLNSRLYGININRNKTVPFSGDKFSELDYINVEKFLDVIDFGIATDSLIASQKIRKDLQISTLPVEVFLRVKNELMGPFIGPLLIHLYTGIEIRRIPIIWPSYKIDIEAILSPNSENNLNLTNRNELGLITNEENIFTQNLSRLENLLGRIGDLRDREGGLPLEERKKESSARIVDFISILSDIKDSVPNTESDFKQIVISLIEEYIPLITEIRSIKPYISQILEFKELYRSKSKQFIPGFNLSIKEILSNPQRFKAFAYYFCSFLLEEEDIQEDVEKLKETNIKILPPTMQAFRVHHYIDDTSHIIQNNIVASTKEMWNTVLIQHPAKGSANDVVSSLGDVYTSAKLNSGVDWNYYPKSDVTGVMGLQFHPSLTLANKKLMVATEINAYSPETLAKLACQHLAQGMRKMYRGNLLIKGKVIKPHDRIVLNDKYNDMSGPVEVESVVHHWSADSGWVTNIIPQAVCDANPGAAILQTAALEKTYNLIFNTIDTVSDLLMVATLVGTLGGGAAIGGAFTATGGIRKLLKDLIFNKKGLADRSLTVATQLYRRGRATGRAVLKDAGVNPIKIVRNIFKTFRGPINQLLTNYTVAEAAELISYGAYNLQVVSGFVENSRDVEQLPVKLSPLLFEGRPLLAGLETDEAVFSIFAVDTFYSVAKLNELAENYLTSLYDDYSSSSNYIPNNR